MEPHNPPSMLSKLLSCLANLSRKTFLTAVGPFPASLRIQILHDLLQVQLAVVAQNRF
jgi:hypothetical protein